MYNSAIAAASRMSFISSASGGGPAGVNAAPGASLGTWQELGPSNIGGRTRALLVHPTSPSIMYAAGVAGGVWKSINAGATWAQLTDLGLPNLAVTNLVMDPGNPNVIYAGTGEGFFNADAVRGAGIFRTTDAGANWAQLPSTANSDFLLCEPAGDRELYRLETLCGHAHRGFPQHRRRRVLDQSFGRRRRSTAAPMSAFSPIVLWPSSSRPAERSLTARRSQVFSAPSTTTTR